MSDSKAYVQFDSDNSQSFELSRNLPTGNSFLAKIGREESIKTSNIKNIFTLGNAL